MKKLWLLFLFSQLVFAADVQVPRTGTIVLLTTTNWGGSFNNNYVFSSTTTDTGTCVTVVNNNPTSSHTYNLNVQITSDSRSNGPTADPTKWFSVAPQATGLSVASNPGGAGPFPLKTTFANTFGAARISIGISGTTTAAGNPDTATVFAIQSRSGCGGNYGASLFGNGTSPWSASVPADQYYGVKPVPLCDKNATVLVASGTTTKIENAGTLDGQIGGFKVCAYSISGAATTGSADLTIGYGDTATTCAIVAAIWTVTIGATTVPNYSGGNGLGAIMWMNPNAALCVQNGATTSAVRVSLNYTYY